MRCSEANEILLPLQDEFSIRFYRWSQEECRRELASNFARVRRVRSSLVLLFLEFAVRHSPADLEALMLGNLKRFSPRAVGLLKEATSSHEEAMRREFLSYFEEEIVIGGRRVRAFRVPAEERQLRDALATGKASLISGAKQLRRALEQSLARSGFAQIDRYSRGLTYCEKLGDWYLMFSFDLSGKSQLSCDALISARPRLDSCRTDLSASINLLNWCGVHPGTQFDLISVAELAATAEFIATIYVELRRAMPELLDGLRHDIPKELDDATHLRREPPLLSK